MRVLSNNFFLCLTIFSSILFTNCETQENENLTVTIEDKVQLLEKGEWLPEGFEDNTMYKFENGERLTFYANNGVFSNEALPITQEYNIVNDLFELDFNFGNVKSYDIKFTCNDNIVEFYVNEELINRMFKRGSDYKECLQ